MALRIVALAASLALATAAPECDVCHLHYFHKVLTRASTHFSSYPCRHKTALGFPGTHNHLFPPPNVAGLTTAPSRCFNVQDVSSAEVFDADVKQCREYQSESCCSAKTAARCEREMIHPNSSKQT
jgi:hypothetical protein